MPKQQINLDDLYKRREEIQKKLEKKKEDINLQWMTLVTPTQADTKIQSWFNQVERAVAVYDGVMTGYRIFQRFSGFFSIFKKKRK